MKGVTMKASAFVFSGHERQGIGMGQRPSGDHRPAAPRRSARATQWDAASAEPYADGVPRWNPIDGDYA
jgi:hypothetical protein